MQVHRLRVNFNCWGLQPSIYPFAARHAGGGLLGSKTLQDMLLASQFALLFGAVSPIILPKCRTLAPLTALFTIASAGLYAAAFGIGVSLWTSPLGRMLLVGCAATLRFLEAYLSCMVYTLISERHPREQAGLSFATGICDRALVTLGTFLSVFLVDLLQSREQTSLLQSAHGTARCF